MIIILSQACEKLLAHRVDVKLKTHKVADIINRLHVAIPKARDDKVCTLHGMFSFHGRVWDDASTSVFQMIRCDSIISCSDHTRAPLSCCNTVHSSVIDSHDSRRTDQPLFPTKSWQRRRRSRRQCRLRIMRMKSHAGIFLVEYQ